MTTSIYAINAVTLAPAQLVGTIPTAANAVVSHAGELYVMSSTHLYQLAGTTDDGTDVDKKLETGQLRLGVRDDQGRMVEDGRFFNIFQVTPFLQGDAKVDLTLIAVTQGTETEIGPFSYLPEQTTDMIEHRIKTGRRHRGTSYRIRLESAGSLKVRSMSIYYDVYFRRG